MNRDKLLRPGISPKVIADGYNEYRLFAGGKIVIEAYTAEPLPGLWVLGFRLLEGMNQTRRLPGEGNGWFASEPAALYWFGGALKKRSEKDEAFGQAAKEADKVAYRLSQRSLFEGL